MQHRVAAISLACVAAGSFLISVGAPLLTYGLSLALFGITHVLSELRYVDERFGKHIKKRFAAGLALLVLAVVVFRILVITNVVPSWRVTTIEVILVFLISLYSATLLQSKGKPPWLAFFVAALIFGGLVISPTGTLLVLAMLHNLTPIGFIAERTPHEIRRPVLALCLIIFIGVPLVILSGSPRYVLQNFIGFWPDTTLLATGPLSTQLGVYLPRAIRDSSWAIDAFSAAAFAQCMHYVAVIHVLPRMSASMGADDKRGSWIQWPSQLIFSIFVGVASLFFAIGFFLDFQLARSVYGIFAAVHAWLEIPLLMLAFALIGKSAKPIAQSNTTWHSQPTIHTAPSSKLF